MQDFYLAIHGFSFSLPFEKVSILLKQTFGLKEKGSESVGLKLGESIGEERCASRLRNVREADWGENGALIG